MAGQAVKAQPVSGADRAGVMDSQINVAVVYSQYLHIGGVETHLLALLRQPDLAHYRWLIVAPTSPEFVRQASPARTLTWAAPRACDPRALINLVHLLRQERVQLVHAHNPRAALYGGLAARWLGLPMLVTVHLPAYYWVRGQTRLARLRRWAYQQMEKALNRWLVDQVIYVSHQVYVEALRLGVVTPARAWVIPNGLEFQPDASERATNPSVPWVAPGTPVICCVARLETQKGIDVLLEALHHLRVQDWRLWLVGDGSQRESLSGQAQHLGLEDRIDFLGFRADVAGLLRASDIFVLPSRYEAMSLALLEALSAGCPCVVTDVGENAGVVETEVNGLVVPAEDPAQLAAALERLLVDASLRRRLGQAAQQAARRFDAARMGHQVEMVYAALLAKPT